jgi:succinoglycan biosynthesis transport protein ExoP
MPEKNYQVVETRQNTTVAARSLRMAAASPPPPFAASLFRVAVRYRWYMVALVLGVTAATYVLSSRLTSIYESTATIDIDPQAPHALIGQDSLRGGAVSDVDQLLATQVSLVQSDAVLRPVADKYNLLQREGQYKSSPSDNTRLASSPTLLKKLKVKRAPNTYLVTVSYRSEDSQLAVAVANAVALSYVQYINSTRAQATSNMAGFMQGQLEELRGRMEASSKTLAKLQSELNVVKPDDKTSIVSARLLQLNTQYTDAQANRIEKESVYNATKTGSLESEQLAPQGGALKALLQKEDEARTALAQIKQVYGGKHPEARKAAAELAAVHAEVESARESVRKQSELDYQQALNREQLLARAVSESKSEFDSLNTRSFQYERARQEAENDRLLYDDLVRKIRETSINNGFQNSAIRIADLARPGRKPVFPEPALYAAIAFVLSAGLVPAAFLLVALSGNTVSAPDDIADEFGVRVLGSLPNVRLWKDRPQLLAAADAQEIDDQSSKDLTSVFYRESIRSLRSSLLVDQLDRRIKVLLVTSCMAGEGKSTAAAHLALAYAAQGKNVLLIDGDLRRPSQHGIFNVSNTHGLTEVLTQRRLWHEAVVSTHNEFLDILPAGAPSRQATDRIDFLTQIFAEAADRYALVIVDSPPLLAFAETVEMAPAVDGVVLITRAGLTTRQNLGEGIARLTGLRANILGVILNGFSAPHAARYYKHHYSSAAPAAASR